MPGRVCARNTTSFGAPHASSTHALTVSKSNASLRAATWEEAPTSALRTQICNIFNDAQKTTVGHRKLAVSLRKLQESCDHEPQRPSKSSQEEYDENGFAMEITRCIVRLMSAKKSEAVGDRLVHFLGTFLQHAWEKGNVTPCEIREFEHESHKA